MIPAYIFFIGLFIICFICTILLLRYYARKDTSWLAYVSAFAGWYSSFILIGIVPYDIYVVYFFSHLRL